MYILHNLLNHTQIFIIVFINNDIISSSVQVDSVVAAEYELEYLLLEGHCFDVTTGQPPRGLQFTLGTASEPVIVDTIVMANLVSGRHRLIWGINGLKMVSDVTVHFCDHI